MVFHDLRERGFPPEFCFGEQVPLLVGSPKCDLVLLPRTLPARLALARWIGHVPVHSAREICYSFDCLNSVTPRPVSLSWSLSRASSTLASSALSVCLFAIESLRAPTCPKKDLAVTVSHLSAFGGPCSWMVHATSLGAPAASSQQQHGHTA